MTHPVRRSGSELPTLSGTKIDIALYMVSVSQGFMCENTFLLTSAILTEDISEARLLSPYFKYFSGNPLMVVCVYIYIMFFFFSPQSHAEEVCCIFCVGTDRTL